MNGMPGVSGKSVAAQLDSSEAQQETHIVQQGQENLNLSEISKQLAVTEQALKDANPQIKNFNKLNVGQEIKLPPKQPTKDLKEADAAPSRTSDSVSKQSIRERNIEGSVMQARLASKIPNNPQSNATNLHSWQNPSTAGTPQTAGVGQATGPRPEIKTLQENINKWREAKGDPTRIKEDGLPGPNTDKAVLEFQKDSGIKPQDGIAGPATKERLSQVLDILKEYPNSPLFMEDRSRIIGLIGNPGFGSLDGPTQKDVLKRVADYTKGARDNITNLSNVITQSGFERMSPATQKQMLHTLNARPSDAALADNLGQLVSSDGFRGLDEPTQKLVLQRIERYGGNRARIDNLENLITTTNRFDQISKESRDLMLTALANHPNDSRLVDNFRTAVDNPNFSRTVANPTFPTTATSLDQIDQTEVLTRIVNYPRDASNVNNLMNLMTDTGFRNLPPNVRLDILDSVPTRFNNQTLTGGDVANFMILAGAPGLEKIKPEIRNLMFDQLANRVGNFQLANALLQVAQDPRIRHNDRLARDLILQANDSIP